MLWLSSVLSGVHAPTVTMGGKTRRTLSGQCWTTAPHTISGSLHPATLAHLHRLKSSTTPQRAVGTRPVGAEDRKYLSECSRGRGGRCWSRQHRRGEMGIVPLNSPQRQPVGLPRRTYHLPIRLAPIPLLLKSGRGIGAV